MFNTPKSEVLRTIRKNSKIAITERLILDLKIILEIFKTYGNSPISEFRFVFCFCFCLFFCGDFGVCAYIVRRTSDFGVLKCHN